MLQQSNTPPKSKKVTGELQSQAKYNEKFQFSKSADSFQELIQYSFFDKTNFLKVFILNKEHAIQINRPRRWGKTLALDMIKRFFQPHLDDIKEHTDKSTFEYDFKKGNRNWKLFQNLNISKDKRFVEEYFGQYPVIHVNFKNVSGDNEAMMLNSLKVQISKVFYSHSYVLKRLKDIDKNYEDDELKFQIQQFQDYQHLRQDSLDDSLFFLSQLLYDFFKRKVIVLIDECDCPIMDLVNAQLQGNENSKLIQWTTYRLTKILGSLIKNNEYVKKALLVGVLDTLRKEGGSGLNNVVLLSLVSNPYEELQLMIGLTQEEIEKFIKQEMLSDDPKNNPDKISKFLEKIKLWYNGYDLNRGDESISLYTPYSVGQYLNDVIDQKNTKFIPAPKSYWIKSGISDILESLIQVNEMQSFKLQLLNFILGTEKITQNQISLFPSLINQPPSSSRFEKIALGILEQTGYLKVQQGSSFYEYPNKEIEIYFKERLIDYVIEFFNLKTFKIYLTDEFIFFDKANFLKFTTQILDKLPKSEQKVENECYFQAFFTCISIYCYLHGRKVTVNAAPEYITGFNKKIDNVFFPTKEAQEKGERKLVIHEYKCTFSENRVQSLLEKAIWQVYAKCYMSGFTKSKDWDFIIIRAIVFYQDKAYKWHLKMEEYQYLNQVAQILMENFFLKDGKLLKNSDDIVEGKNNSREKFLEYYGCASFSDFIQYFDYLKLDLDQINKHQMIEESESHLEQFAKITISDVKQIPLDKILLHQLSKIKERFKIAEYAFTQIIEEDQYQLKQQKQQKSRRSTNIKQMVEGDRAKQRQQEHEAKFQEQRKKRKKEIEGEKQNKGEEENEGEEESDGNESIGQIQEEAEKIDEVQEQREVEHKGEENRQERQGERGGQRKQGRSKSRTKGKKGKKGKKRGKGKSVNKKEGK